MDENQYRVAMDEIIDSTKEALVDQFAELMSKINDRKYDDASLMAHSMAVGLGFFSKGLATEALARRLGDSLDKPE